MTRLPHAVAAVTAATAAAAAVTAAVTAAVPRPPRPPPRSPPRSGELLDEGPHPPGVHVLVDSRVAHREADSL